MEKVIEFIKSNSEIVSIRKMCRDLCIQSGSINLNRNIIPKKHLDAIKEYLVNNYMYDEDAVLLSSGDDNTTSVVPKARKIYNVGRIPHFKDTIYRYQDDVGLWRRASDWCMEKNKEGEKVLKRPWQPQTSEMLNDAIGEFYVCNNGIKMYVSYK